MQKFERVIFYLFAGLFFFVPAVLWPYTSEVFEFNKIILLYFLTTLIAGAWIIKCILARKIIFRRTILDIPLLVFIGSQLISTLLSIDPLTSWLGYYSRFNGGLASILCYSLLYWAFVSNFFKEDSIKLIKILLSSAALVAVYGVLEHFGIDKDLWVQDVASRVFSTLGQPNWLAAWIVALIPITWVLMLNSKLENQNLKLQFKNLNFWIYFSLSILFFWTLIFTKSRSGLLGFFVAFVIFWAGYFWINRKEYQNHLIPFAIISSSLLVISLISGTQWTPSLYSLINKSTTQPINRQAGPALETGGTESGTIRKIVWKGAVQIWQHYPVFGSGVETFAFSYYKYRPVEHNLVSEWDFIYNKAHNEFLNIAANTGTFGLLSYLFLIGSVIYFFIKKLEISNKFMEIALLAGYISLSVTNFFGFSVVPTQIEFFLFPALAIALTKSEKGKRETEKVSSSQKVSITLTLFVLSYSLFAIGRYWYADTLFAKGKAYNTSGKPGQAASYLIKAIKIAPNQALYRNEIANSFTDLALAYYQNKDRENAGKYIKLAITESGNAASLSPANINLKRSGFGVFIRLSVIDPNYLINAQNILIEAVKEAPTDAKILYNLGLTYARMRQPDKAAGVLGRAIKLKTNYKEARLAYAILLIDKGDKTAAKAQLEYILSKIDPNDSLTKQTLESINSH